MSPKMLAAVMLTASTLLAACGGSSKTDSSTTTAAARATNPVVTTAAVTPSPPAKPIKVASGTPLTRAQLIAHGDAICKAFNRKLRTVAVHNQKEFAHTLPMVVAYDHIELSKLSKLVPPSSLASDWGRILRDLQSYEQDSRTVAHYAKVNKLNAVHPIIVLGVHTHEDMRRTAERDGFKSCSTDEDAND